MPTTLITGGSSGIGLETARLLARDGHRLLIVSLLEEELAAAKKKLETEVPGVQVDTLAKDLSQPGSAQAVYDWVRQKGEHLDCLVNNAGFGTYGFIDDIDMQREVDMINLHVVTLYQLTRLFLKDMIARDAGRIINLSSISAFQSNPLLATYGATKSFVLQFSRSINYELKNKGSRVRVTAICPPPIKSTGFQSASNMDGSKLFDSWMVQTPQEVARTIQRSLQTGPDIAIPGRGLKWVYYLTKRLPDSWQTRLSAAHLKPN